VRSSGRGEVKGGPPVGGVLDRYVLRNFAGPFVYVLAALGSLAVVVDIFERLEWLIPNAGKLDASTGQIVLEVAGFYAARLALLLFDLGPAIPLIAAMVAAAGMHRRHEITAAKAAGVSAQRVFLPVVLLGAALGAGAFGAREFGGPAMARFVYKEKTVLLGATDVPVALVSTQGQTPLGDGLVLNVGELDIKTGRARAMAAVYWEEGRSEPTYLWAREASWDGGGWSFGGLGQVFRYSDDPGEGAASPIERLETNLSPRVLEMARVGAEGVSMAELFAGRDRTDMATELHRRLSAPLGWVALLLLGLPLIAGGLDRSPLVGFALSLGIVVIYGLVLVGGWGLALSGELPVAIGTWGPQLLALGLGVLSYRRMHS